MDTEKTCRQKTTDEAGDIGEDSNRSARFVDSATDSHFFRSKTLNELRPFYNGVTLEDRMAEIRKSIYYIRQNWHDFEKFLESLKQFMLDFGGMEFVDPTVRSLSEKLLTSQRDWLVNDEALVQDITYEAIKLYTSKEGYAKMYQLSNNIFRQEGSIATPETIRNVVFLVELINIDLYNYCQKYPQVKNFQGLVYRGMCLENADLEAFRSLRNEPVSRRNIAVPLGLFSGSSSVKVAKDFITKELDTPGEGEPRKPLIIKINVIGLKPEFVELYTKCFPSSVLTTICAVDIHDLSMYPEEQEVLLRGPFMHVLNIYKDERDLLGQPCDVLEAIMLNANRDHISTSRLGDQDDLARIMFGTMVAVTRCEFARKYCEENCLLDDAKEYKDLYKYYVSKLEALLGRE